MSSLIFVISEVEAHCCYLDSSVNVAQMNVSSTMNQSTDDSNAQSAWMSLTGRLWLLLPFVPLSMLCSLFLLVHLLGMPSLRRPIHNHAIIVVLILGLVYVSLNISGSMNFYRLGGVVRPQLPGYCSLWLFVDFGVYNTITVLLAWASFERHLLVFHHWLLNNHRRKLLIHYLPLLSLLIYMGIFYITVVFLLSCTNHWDYASDVCGDYGCYHDTDLLAYWELYLHGLIPNILIIFFNITLLLRVLCHKRLLRQPIRWKKHRKMAFQLLCISALYLTVNFPLFSLTMGQLVGFNAANELWEILFYFTDHVIMFLPFMCLGCLPELWQKLRLILTHVRTSRHPVLCHHRTPCSSCSPFTAVICRPRQLITMEERIISRVSCTESTSRTLDS